MEFLNWETLQLPLATAVGAFGGFPAAPKLFQDLARNEWFQYFVLFVLIYQGGSGQNTQLAAVTTIVVYVAIQMLNMMYERREGYY